VDRRSQPEAQRRAKQRKREKELGSKSHGHHPAGMERLGSALEQAERVLKIRLLCTTCAHATGAAAPDAMKPELPPHGSGRIAQLVEQLTLNQRVLGSSPSASTTFFSTT
jgi:hypothetical protein